VPKGANVPWTVVGSAISNSAGNYAVRISNPGAIQAASNWAANGDYVNFTVVARDDGHGDLYSFSAPLASMTAKKDNSRTRAQQHANLNLVASAKPGGYCPDKPIKSLGKHTVVVGLVSSRVKRVKASFDYSDGQSSSLGVGFEPPNGSWTESGTSSVTETSTVGFPGQQGQHSTLDKTYFKYEKYITCLGFLAKATEYAGGGKIGSEGAPVAKHCVPYPKGSNFNRTTSKASAFSTGVSIAQNIGINLSSQTGWDSQGSLSFTFPTRTFLCGKNDLPGGTEPGTIVAGLYDTGTR
jgi:hypothetical protein